MMLRGRAPRLRLRYQPKEHALQFDQQLATSSCTYKPYDAQSVAYIGE